MGNKNSSPGSGNWEPQSTNQPSTSSGWQHSSGQAAFSQYAQNYPKPNANPPPQDQHNTSPPKFDTPANVPPRNYPVVDAYPVGYPQNQYDAPPPPPPDFDISHNARPQGYPVQDAYSAGYPTQDQYNVPYAVPYNAPSHNYPPSQAHAPEKKFNKRYSMIADNYNSLEQVSDALARAGLESSNLIVGIDFTKSNEWTGKRSYNGQSLHHIGYGPNPYEQAITIIGKTLAVFDDDNLIPCFGFGDASTHDQDVFSFYPDQRCCHGFEEVIRRYRELVPNVKLAGPTSFAPIVEMAMTIVEKSGGQYHVLLIIADGQVTRSVDTEYGQLSPQEQKTVQAIVEASKFPLSIILVGVGDGPWDTMKEFDDYIPAREFDNFQFVNFTEIMSKNVPQTKKETEFALAALMEIPLQYKATMEYNLLGERKGHSPERFALPPPQVHGSASQSIPIAADFQRHTSSYYEHSLSADAAPSAPSYPPFEQQICPICLSNPKDMAFGCGHQTCVECGKDLRLCPICRLPIETRLKLY